MSSSENQTGKVIDINRIMQLIPHRYPFLMVDKVIDVIPDDSAVGVKNVCVGEPHFQGHFPSSPIMPGVLDHRIRWHRPPAVLVVETLGPDRPRASWSIS